MHVINTRFDGLNISKSIVWMNLVFISSSLKYFHLKYEVYLLSLYFRIQDILIDARHAVTSFTVNPMLPYHLAIGCKDSVVRVFDRRTLGTSANTRSVNRNRGWMTGLFCKFRPSNIKQDTNRRVTSLQYR